jgi:hypothetical protein
MGETLEAREEEEESVSWKEGCSMKDILPMDLEKQDVRFWTKI